MSGDNTYVVKDGALIRFSGPGGRVTVPAGVTEIAPSVFSGSRGIMSIVLPPGLKRIGAYAFFACSGLTSVIFPDGLESIGDHAFADCTRLKNIWFPWSLRRFRSGGDPCPIRLGEGAFSGCRALQDREGYVIVGDTLFAYYGPKTRLVLPEGLAAVESGAFSDDGTLETVLLPESLKRIGANAFRRCGRLENINLPEGLETIGRAAFCGCRSLADGEGFLIRRGVLFGYFGPPGEVTVPEGVRRIDRGAFGQKEGLLRLTLPDSLEHIDPDVFYGGELILRVRRWTPELTEAVKSCRVRAILTETPELVPAKLLRALRIGIALDPEADLSGPGAGDAKAWLSRNAISLCRDAFELPELLHFLCAHRLIRPGAADAYIEEARRRNVPELTALMLDYVNLLGPSAVGTARERKEERAAAAEEARISRISARKPEDGIAGLSFSASGWRSQAAVRAFLEARGAKLTPSVTAGTDYLLVRDPGESSAKSRRAGELGVPLLTEAELLAMAGEKGG